MTMNNGAVILITLCLTTRISYSLTSLSSLVQTHFEMKNLGAVQLFLCAEDDAVKFLQHRPGFSSVEVEISKPSSRVAPLEEDQPSRVGVFVNLTCEHGRTLLRNSLNSPTGYFNGSYSWLVYHNEFTTGINLLSEPKSILIYTDVVLVTLDDSGLSNVAFYEVFRMHISTNLKWTKLAVRNSKNHNITILSEPNPRVDFEGQKIVVALMLSKLKVNMNNVTEMIALVSDKSYLGEIDILTRSLFSLFLHLEEYFNMTYTYVLSSAWGFKTSDGHWTGLVGQMETHEAEFGVSIARFRTDRYSISDYIISLHQMRICFNFLQPRLLGSANALLTPLELEVWICTIVLCFAIMACYLVIMYYYAVPTVTAVGNSLLDVFGALTQEGIEDSSVSNNFHYRLVSFISLVTTFFIVIYYNGGVLTSLLTPSASTINDLHSLLKSPLRLILLEVPYNHEKKDPLGVLLTNDTESTIISKKLQTSSQVYFDPEEGAKLVKKGKFAFYSEDSVLYPFIEKTFTDAEICSLSHIEKISPFHCGMIAANDSPYRELFAKAFTLLRERGLIKRFKKLWYPQKPYCQWRQDAISLSAESHAVAYIVLVFGMAMSLVLLFMEKYFVSFFQ